MTPALPDSKKLNIIAAFERNEPPHQIAQDQGVSYSYANRLRRQHLEGGIENVLAKPIRKTGPKRSLTPEMVEGMLEHLRLNPTAYQDKLAYFVYDQYGVWPHKSTISRRLKEAKISQKKVVVGPFRV
ncbi:MAG: hypothetical protein M1829_003792 [Trizodia sp. TS-e1964]|nr:MAG: hypothetical protein M1829_003792 [Trizodia sp. TS-e1964]